MRKIKYSLFTGFSILILLAACKPERPSLEDLDLLQHGIPIVIKAPTESVVTNDDLGFWKDVTVQKGEDYNIQIIISSANTLNISLVKNEKLIEVKQEPFFSKIIQEDENGFIYEKKIDDVLDYDFRLIRIQGDQEYIFQTGLLGTFTENQVRAMYEAVQ